MTNYWYARHNDDDKYQNLILEQKMVRSPRNGTECNKSELLQLGMQVDKIWHTSLARVDNHDKRHEIEMAWRRIYRDKYSVTCKAVEGILKSESRVPTSVKHKLHNIKQHVHMTFQNAFSICLAHFNFNLYPMMVVDLMHEFEQGIWKNLFTHLIRILHTSNPALVIEMDCRYISPIYCGFYNYVFWLLEHISGTAKFPVLDGTLSASSQLNPLNRRKWLWGILKISYK